MLEALPTIDRPWARNLADFEWEQIRWIVVLR
jgi:hypothetical protein